MSAGCSIVLASIGGMLGCGSSTTSTATATATAAYTGTYNITATKCGTTAATGVLATLITSPSTFKITIGSATFAKIFGNATCTITGSGTVVQTAASIVMTGTGNWACTGTGCPALATSIMGIDVCTSATTVGTNLNGTYTYAPTGGVLSAAAATLTATATDTVCSQYSQTDFITYTGTKQ